MKIRTAKTTDAVRLLEIYTPVVEHTAISFELNPPTTEDLADRIATYTQSHEWLVAEKSDEVLGYAYATPHRSREAYQYSVETSVYVNKKFRGEGIGKQLYTELFIRLKKLGFHGAFAGIALPNDSSVALHTSVGFVSIGVFREVGYKLGSWHDVSWWQRSIE